jgi:hypothetical protein
LTLPRSSLRLLLRPERPSVHLRRLETWTGTRRRGAACYCSPGARDWSSYWSEERVDRGGTLREWIGRSTAAAGIMTVAVPWSFVVVSVVSDGEDDDGHSLGGPHQP